MVKAQIILAFDTSAAHCAAALFYEDWIIAQETIPMAKGQAEYLIPMLQTMLTSKGMTWRDLTALAVGVGPGNFTGIRISVSAARGLALGLGIPAIGVSNFEAMMWQR
ncbi:MAG: tRNA (adenosine(37)-N6)-threonylcarbamoyltransferase complex dimerization subunit type 1 TsaB, partial [Rhodoferax sp.]|nr:tRNA (adenosine(37)-N6)-threonylcarbamoyltransferase complex dimerization subunit type 1 TsaB [Pseudorhodobacter sp.]